jgi:hypothetical protein
MPPTKIITGSRITHLSKKDYLSLAEVQVMGVDLLRFAEVGYSRASNNFSGWHDAPNYPNWGAFAILHLVYLHSNQCGCR